MKPFKTLVFIPTYNERENVEQLCEQICSLKLSADILFIDDNSPDGTGQILDEIAKKTQGLFVIHRSGKLGVGSAHLDGIAWAYDHDYERLITLDCDFTHSPEDISKLLAHAPDFDVVLGSRFLEKDSLPGWTAYRRFLTHFGHFLTRHLLKIKQDATGAFRIYDLSRIPRSLFERVESKAYSFFFESLFLLTRNGFRIKEVSIVLPTRTYGHSKMTKKHILQSVLRILSLFWGSVTRPAKFSVERSFKGADSKLIDPQGWASYWKSKSHASGLIYEIIAEIYRKLIIRRELNRAIRNAFTPSARLLHAGCGSGQVDQDLQHEMRIVAVDISPEALELYQRNVPYAVKTQHASIFGLPYADGSFDGIYNLGVMEHFTAEEIIQILREFHRVLAPGGKLVLFWPHEKATSVWFLKKVHWFFQRVLRRKIQLHPPEISLVKSQEDMDRTLAQADFQMVDYSFGPRDFFVQARIIAEKRRR
ncbi:MAG: hypothetical protein JWM68_2471 [Verrucomicrobiales bacterium]|nr:hypothetical protein [Verrucomicrobiales bacterium]